MNRIAVKIGSNVLTRSDGSLDHTRMSALVDQVCELLRQGCEVIIISSGAVASGRDELGDAGRLDTVSQRQLYSAVGQVRLMQTYYQLFKEHGYCSGQVLTTKENFSTRHHYLNQKNCMEVMLSQGVVPIVNENDTISLTELMFTDNDELAGLVATMMECRLLIILTNVDGVFTGDPESPSSCLLHEIGPDSDGAAKYIREKKSSAGRGGMRTKYSIARKVALEGIPVAIANGKRDDILISVAKGDGNVPYTLFTAGEKPISGVKKWIAHSGGFARGSVTVNKGAADALLSGSAASLLPIGITAVEGDFEKDDIVRILAPDGRCIAVGKAGCDAASARKMMGRQNEREFIHYDYLYIEQL
jgi:glutamate 5-kinase